MHRESRRAVSCATKCDHLLNFSLAVLIALAFCSAVISVRCVCKYVWRWDEGGGSLLSGGIREVEEEEEEEASEIQDSFADIQAKREL
mmetsp:Transcript_27643/g.44958  ORF Transcript_27643/g.44958 Transcript_27643/m.44958 type:complete len:88 (-) Transcript_27643:123-386(-)